MSWYVPTWVMLRHGVSVRALDDHGTLGSNADIALAVLAGDYDAGAVTFAIYERYANDGLRVLEDLPRTPNLTLLTRADFPPADVERLRQALQALHTTPGGRTVLHALHSDMTALIPVNDDAFRPLRSMMQTVQAAE
jgi:phosphonate transport system substrate-binding protein